MGEETFLTKLTLLSENDRASLKGLLDPTAHDTRLVHLAVKLALEVAGHAYDRGGERFLTVVNEDSGEKRDIYLGEW